MYMHIPGTRYVQISAVCLQLFENDFASKSHPKPKPDRHEQYKKTKNNMFI